MMNKYLQEEMGIDQKVLDLVAKAEKEVSVHFAHLDDIMAYNQYKVLDAFQKIASVILTSPGRQDMVITTWEERLSKKSMPRYFRRKQPWFVPLLSTVPMPLPSRSWVYYARVMS